MDVIMAILGGAFGGALIGKAIKGNPLGLVVNGVIGALAGLGGGALASLLFAGTALANEGGQFVGGAIAGVVVVVIVGLIAKAVKGNAAKGKDE